MNAPIKIRAVEDVTRDEDIAARIPNRPVVDPGVFQMTCQEQQDAIAGELEAINADMLQLRDQLKADDAEIARIEARQVELRASIAGAEQRRADLIEMAALKSAEYQGYEAILRRRAGQ